MLIGCELMALPRFEANSRGYRCLIWQDWVPAKCTKHSTPNRVFFGRSRQRDARGLSLRSIRLRILTNSAMLEWSSSKAGDNSEGSSAALCQFRAQRPNHANIFIGHSQLFRDGSSWKQFD